MNILDRITAISARASSLWLLGLFFIARMFSYIGYTRGIGAPTAILSGILYLGFLLALQRDRMLALYLICIEIFFFGSGGFLTIGTLKLRTLFLGTFGFVFLMDVVKDFFHKKWRFSSRETAWLSGYGALCAYMFFRGISMAHSGVLVFQDTISYAFLLLLAPLWYYKKSKISPKHIKNIVFTWCISQFIFVFGTFIAFSSEKTWYFAPYYHWFRNVAGGKITDMGLGMYRIVLPEHILLVPLIAGMLFIWAKKKDASWLVMLPLGILLMLNMTRIYLVALAAIVFVLFFLQKGYGRIRYASAAVLFGLTAIFSLVSISLIASGGTSSGLELFGLPVGSSNRNESRDVSASTRQYILPIANEEFFIHPLLGQGVGKEITFYNPAIEEEVTRTQFDLGYHEMAVELGILGMLAFFVLLFVQSKQVISEQSKGLIISIFIAFFVINITTSAWFYGHAIVLLAVLFGNIMTYSQLALDK